MNSAPPPPLPWPLAVPVRGGAVGGQIEAMGRVYPYVGDGVDLLVNSVNLDTLFLQTWFLSNMMDQPVHGHVVASSFWPI
jgi:hypothetical protein